MIGSTKAIRIPLRNGSRERTSGKAAAVPTKVLIAVTSAARRAASSRARRGSGSRRARCGTTSSVQPVIGNVPYRFALKLNSTSSTIGPNRKT